jgi:hypothetical protein
MWCGLTARTEGKVWRMVENKNKNGRNWWVVSQETAKPRLINKENRE